MYNSGNEPVFYDRISWALSHLNMAGLVQKPRRGYYQITDIGLEFLSTPDKINDYVTENIRNRQQTQGLQNIIPLTLEEQDIKELTPHEKI